MNICLGCGNAAPVLPTGERRAYCDDCCDPAPVPPDERLAETPESLKLQHGYTSWTELLVDAALGAALREALAERKHDEELVITASGRVILCWDYGDGLRNARQTDAHRALAALLSREPEERTRT